MTAQLQLGRILISVNEVLAQGDRASLDQLLSLDAEINAFIDALPVQYVSNRARHRLQVGSR